MNERFSNLEKALDEMRKRQREDYNQLMGGMSAVHRSIGEVRKALDETNRALDETNRALERTNLSLADYQHDSLQMIDLLHGALLSEVGHRDQELDEIRARLDKLEGQSAA